MTFFTTFFFLSVIIYPNLATSNVLDLHKGNFDQTISSNPYVLVEFYVPWCSHCNEFKPEFYKTAELLEQNGSPIKIAKVNAEKEKALAAEHGIKSYPTLKLYKNQYPVDYHGTKTAHDIVDWLQTNTGPVNNQIDTL